MSFRAFQTGHSVAVTQYGKATTSGVYIPATDMLNLIISPCVTACSLFVSNERLWCNYLKSIGADTFVSQESHTKKAGLRKLFAKIASTAHSPWLPVCICGNHMQSGDVAVERSTWKPLTAVSIAA